MLPRWLMGGVIFFVTLATWGALFPALSLSEERPRVAREATDLSSTEPLMSKGNETAPGVAPPRRPAEAVVDEDAAKTVEMAAEKAADSDAGNVSEKAAEKVAEKAAEKAMEKAAEEATAKRELIAKRPEHWRGPTEVQFFMFVVDIDEIDAANQNFAANIYVMLKWKDDRLAEPGTLTRQLPLADVWNPRVLVANQVGLMTRSLPEVVQVDAHGTVTYHQRYTGKVSQPLRLSNFPMDKHYFTIQFAAAGYTANDLTFKPQVREAQNVSLRGGGIADELSLPDWNVLKYDTSTSPYAPVVGANTAGFAFRFQAKRYIAYYLWQIILPLMVVVIMSWAAFWIDMEDIGVRVGVGTSSILTLIAYRFVVAGLLPRLPYMTRIDYFMVGSTLLVLLVLVIVIWTSFLAVHNRGARAQRTNHWARRIFPALFFLQLTWFLFWPGVSG
jgi:hypothetical protein